MGNFSTYVVFQEEISRARGLLHRRNEATVATNAPSNPLCLRNASPMGTLRTDDFACWVHLARRKERQPVRACRESRGGISQWKCRECNGGWRSPTRSKMEYKQCRWCKMCSAYLHNKYIPAHTT